MTERSRARRHRGRHAPYAVPASRQREEVADPTSVAYWQARIDKPLFVYFIQATDGGPGKIGQAEAPAKRLAELQCGNPRELVIRAVVLAGVETEKAIHMAWRDTAHVRGEWFGHGLEEALVNIAEATMLQQVIGYEEHSDPRRAVTYATAMLAHRGRPVRLDGEVAA